MSSGGMTMGDQWVQGIMNQPGLCRTVNIWAQRTINSRARYFSGVIRRSGAIGCYLLSPCGV